MTPAEHRADPPAGLSRRDALKRGAVVGGALLWTAPVVQAVAMTAAQAESPSGPPRSGSGDPGRGKGRDQRDKQKRNNRNKRDERDRGRP